MLGVPRWLVILGSVVIVFHFGTIAVRSMAAMSGPWMENNGEAAPPPQSGRARQDAGPR